MEIDSVNLFKNSNFKIPEFKGNPQKTPQSSAQIFPTKEILIIDWKKAMKKLPKSNGSQIPLSNPNNNFLSSHKYVFSFVGRNTCKYSLHASLGMRV
jgi:hypothetical protein